MAPSIKTLKLYIRFPAPHKTVKLYIPFTVPVVARGLVHVHVHGLVTRTTTSTNPLYFDFELVFVLVGVLTRFLCLVWYLSGLFEILGVLSWIVGVWVLGFDLVSLYLKSKDKRIKVKNRAYAHA